MSHRNGMHGCITQPMRRLPETGRKIWQKPHLANADRHGQPAIGRRGMTIRAATATEPLATTKPGPRVSSTMARYRVAETLTGAVVIVAAVAFLAYAVAHSGRSIASGYPLLARFDHIDGLAIGSDVRIAGVKVGTVTDERIDTKTFSAVVSMSVQNDIQLPKDSAALITSESLLGGKYITLSPGGDETTLKPGQTITITQSSVSLEELLGKFIFSVTTLNNAKDGAKEGGSQSGGSKPAPPSGPPSAQGGSGALAPLPK